MTYVRGPCFFKLILLKLQRGVRLCVGVDTSTNALLTRTQSNKSACDPTEISAVTFRLALGSSSILLRRDDAGLAVVLLRLRKGSPMFMSLSSS